MRMMGLKGNWRWLRAGGAACLLLAAAPAPAQMASPGYATLAKAYLAEPAVMVVTVRGTKKLPKTLAPAAPGQVRQLIEADVARVLKAPGMVNARITYLWEGPADAKGKAPAFKKQTLLLFLRPLSLPEAGWQLAAPANQMAWSVDAESRLRAIAQEAQKPELRDMRLTGLLSAFTTEADPPFARLTQFLFANRADPLGITVRVKPDGTGDVIQSSEEFLGGGLMVQANTLVWYHLACTTPAQLPDSVLADQPSDDERKIVVKDYATLKKALGPCT